MLPMEITRLIERCKHSNCDLRLFKECKRITMIFIARGIKLVSVIPWIKCRPKFYSFCV